MTPPPAGVTARITERFAEVCAEEGMPSWDGVFFIALTLLAAAIALHPEDPDIDDYLGAVGLFREPGL